MQVTKKANGNWQADVNLSQVNTKILFSKESNKHSDRKYNRGF